MTGREYFAHWMIKSPNLSSMRQEFIFDGNSSLEICLERVQTLAGTLMLKACAISPPTSPPTTLMFGYPIPTRDEHEFTNPWAIHMHSYTQEIIDAFQLVCARRSVAVSAGQG